MAPDSPPINQPTIGPTIGTQKIFPPSVSPLFLNPATTVNSLGPKSRAGLIAYPCIPPNAIPIATTTIPIMNGARFPANQPAHDRPHNRHPKNIPSIRQPVILKPRDHREQPRPKIPRRIDRIPVHPPERHPDRHHHHPDHEWRPIPRQSTSPRSAPQSAPKKYSLHPSARYS